MKWELNESKYASGPAQTSSILKALHMEDEKRPRKTGSLNESMQMNEGVTKDCSVGFDFCWGNNYFEDHLQEYLDDALGEYSPNYINFEASDAYEDDDWNWTSVYFDVPSAVVNDPDTYKAMEQAINKFVNEEDNCWTGYISLDSIQAYESLQLSGTSKLNGRRNLRRGKENPDNIKTAGNKTKLTGDYDLRESYDDDTFDEVTHMLYSCLEKIFDNVYGARKLTYGDLKKMFEFAYIHLKDELPAMPYVEDEYF